MVSYYQHHIAPWMDGTEGLSDGAYRVYHTIVQIIYLNDGPIVINEHGLAGRCNMHLLKFRKYLSELLKSEKISKTGDGRITNCRAELELAKVGTKRGRVPANYHSNPPATPEQPPPLPPPLPPSNPGGVARGSAGGLPSKPLKSKDAQNAIERVDLKERKMPQSAAQETFFENEKSPPDVAYYGKARSLFGEKAGGIATQLLKSKGNSIPLARAALETASTKSNPREYVNAIINKSTGPSDEHVDGRI